MNDNTEIVHLPPPKHQRSPHVFGEAMTIAPEISDTGYEQKEKTCKNCGTVRVTVLGPLPWRRWRQCAGSALVASVEAPCFLLATAP